MLKFAQPGDGGNMWGPILEKAWAKVKGAYENSEGGFLKTGSIEGGQLEITIGKGGKCCKGATDGSSTVVHINGKVLLAKGGQAGQNDNGGRGWSGGGCGRCYSGDR